MIDPEAAIDPERLNAVRRASIEKLGVMFDPSVVERILNCIVARVRDGTVGDGITHAELVRGSGVPSWVGYGGFLGHVLALVSLHSYTEHAVLVSALTRTREDEILPTDGFCEFLERLGLVGSKFDREACLDMWDYHWKQAVMRLDRQDDD